MNQLVFIYKTGSGWIENAVGAAKKALGGESACALCNITHGPVREKSDWRVFLETLEPQPAFYHEDEIPDDVRKFLERTDTELPIVLEKNSKGSYRVAIGNRTLESCNGSPECLINAIKDAL